MTYLTRHAELVSASIAKTIFKGPRRGWTLKRVQGDKDAELREKR